MSDPTTTPPTPAALAPTALIDSDHPAVVAFAREHDRGADPRERAVSLYLAVRDGFRYDPYRIDLSPQGMRASTVLSNGYGWCVPKAALLTAACRAVGIPARVGYADVRNHLSTERLRKAMNSDVYVWHGYSDIWLDGRWVKATPAFNIELCDRFGLLPLEFDGRGDSIYHPYDKAGNRHMEYVNQRGVFNEVPLAEIIEGFKCYHPNATLNMLSGADFSEDAARETSA
ncbi:MAG TPA: transglutaminase family protein [Rubrivivax sp.]|nr:transglutaminase family protein [Burkholderiales bacterium]HNU10719.1 transglutaminase family protein [Rubrivivax sp.]